MSGRLILTGKASGTKKTFSLSLVDTPVSALDFLLSQNIPIAYSCHGEKICRKCTDDQGRLLCDLVISKDDILEVAISYL